MASAGNTSQVSLTTRGKKVVSCNSNTEDAIPFLVSTQNYGILWTIIPRLFSKTMKKGTSSGPDRGNNIDFILLYGKDMEWRHFRLPRLTGNAHVPVNADTATEKVRTLSTQG